MEGTADSAGFLGAVGGRGSFEDPGAAAAGPSATPSGDAPGPFDGLDGHRLAGPSGSHPLASLTSADLLHPITGSLEGGIELTGSTRVGEGITGTLRVRATHAIKARAAGIRLVGVLIAEETRSGPSREADAANAAIGAAAAGAAAAAAAASMAHMSPGSGSASEPVSAAPDTSTVSWVEVHGRIIEDLTFTEPVLPTLMAPGQVLEVPFSIPAPRLGPPSAHAGSAIVAWAVEAHWDIQLGADERVAVIVPVAQHPDLLRSGAVTLPAGAMFDSVDHEGASLAVAPLPPLSAGAPVTLSVAWPGAPGGRSARVELTTDVRSANGISVVSVSLPLDHESLAGTTVVVPLPADLPPTLVTDGLTVGHRLRVIVDRKMRSDVTAERPIVTI
jgi:hypothetical protein